VTSGGVTSFGDERVDRNWASEKNHLGGPEVFEQGGTDLGADIYS